MIKILLEKLSKEELHSLLTEWDDGTIRETMEKLFLV